MPGFELGRREVCLVIGPGEKLFGQFLVMTLLSRDISGLGHLCCQMAGLGSYDGIVMVLKGSEKQVKVICSQKIVPIGFLLAPLLKQYMMKLDFLVCPLNYFVFLILDLCFILLPRGL